MSGGNAPWGDLIAIIEPLTTDEGDKARFVKLGPLWKGKESGRLTGHIETVPAEWLQGRAQRFQIMVSARQNRGQK